MRKLVKKLIFQEVKEIVSLGCWLLKTVGHLAVRLLWLSYDVKTEKKRLSYDRKTETKSRIYELRWKNRKKNVAFYFAFLTKF